MNLLSDMELVALTNYFKMRNDILASFLFGSVARGKASNDSDIDIAIWLKDEGRRLEFKIWQDIEDILKKDVDLVILNRAPAILSWSIIRKGKPFIIKDRGRYMDILFDISNEAEDFIEFNLDALRRKGVRKRR